MLCRILVIAESPGLRIERYFLAQTIRIVHQMTEHTAIMRVVDIAIRKLRLSFATGGDKRGPVSTRRHATRFDVQRLAFGAAGRIVLASNDTAPVFEVVFVLDLIFVARIVDIANVKEHLLSVGVFSDSHHGVGRFSLIIPLEPTANRHGFDRMRQLFVQSPASDVQLMSALVIQIAVACFPEPMPVVVHIVRMKFIDHRRAAPDVPVQIRGRI